MLPDTCLRKAMTSQTFQSPYSAFCSIRVVVADVIAAGAVVVAVAVAAAAAVVAVAVVSK